MKINKLAITGFRSHKNTEIDGLGRLVIALGPNGSGKSGLVDAIAYAVTGTCRGTDDAGRGYESLLSPDAKQAVVLLDTDLGLVNRMLGQGPKSAAQERVTATLKLERAALKCALRSQVFLDLDPKEQEALMRALVATNVSMEAAKKAMGVELPGVNLASLTTMDGVLGAYKYAFDYRTSLKKMVLNMPEAPAGFEYQGEDVAQMPVEWLAARAGELEQALKDVQSIQNAERERERIRGEIAGIDAELDALRKRIAPYPQPGVLQAQALELEKEADSQNKARQERFAKSRAYANEAAEHEGAAASLRKSIGDIMRLSSSKAACGTCHQRIDKTQVAVVTGELEAQVKEHEAAAKKGREMAKTFDEGNLLPVEAESKLLEVRKQLEAIRTIREHAKGLKERKARAEERMRVLGETPAGVADVAALSSAYQGILAQMNYLKASESARRARAEHESTLEAVEAAVKALGPGGAVRALHMGQGFPEVLKEVSGIAEVLGVGSVKVTASPKWLVEVAGRPAELLSASERFRVSLAFAVVIAKRTGVNMLCLDGADILDDDNRGALIPLVEGLGLDQVIVTATSTQQGEPWPEWTTIRLSNEGGVTKIATLQEA